MVVEPWAWASDGSGGAATRWLWTGMGCLESRLEWDLVGASLPGAEVLVEAAAEADEDEAVVADGRWAEL